MRTRGRTLRRKGAQRTGTGWLEDVARHGTVTSHPPATLAAAAPNADASPNAVGLAAFTALRQAQGTGWTAGLAALALAVLAGAGLKRRG